MDPSALPWRAGSRRLACGARALIMGVVNVTPDSFWEGARHADPGAAVEHALRLVDEGADLVDVGGESSRPPLYGPADPVPADEEAARVLPVIRALRRQSDVAISVDTTKCQVARQALDAGADIVNDISALGADPAMPALVARSAAGAVLMHMRGTPRTMQQNTEYADLLGEVAQYLGERVRVCVEAGISLEQLVVDPGIGFGKSPAGNFALLAGLPRLAALGRPLLVGASRKSFLWKSLGLGPADALEGSLAAAVASVLSGAHIIRVHDVRATVRAVRVAELIRAATASTAATAATATP
jgi:dihydropteroate synthase